MLFNSADFLLFFPLVLFIYFVVPGKIRKIWLLVVSYYFYMGWNARYVMLLLISTLVTYVCGILMENRDIKRRKYILFSGIALNIAILVYYKYFGFGIDILNGIFRTFRWNVKLSWPNVLLPVGISFYIFQALGYMIDVYRGDLPAEKNLLDYALFVSFYPQLVAGPIERSGNLLHQIKECAKIKLWNYERVADGFILMLWGYFVKMVIADRVAILVDSVFDGYLLLGSFHLVAGAMGFALQIYCDFAGYSFIAIGAAKVMGFSLMENFNTPYFAKSVTEFWKRWHISLSTWFRDYIYIPLGGNRCAKWKGYRNILIVFSISGLWHGASWTFVIWGFLHGIFQIAEKEILPCIDKVNRKIGTRTKSIGYKICQAAVTFCMVDFAWIFFRADTVAQAVNYIKRIFTNVDPWVLFDGSIYSLGLDAREMNLLWIAVMILILVSVVKKRTGKTIDGFLKEQPLPFRWAVLLFLLFYTVLFGCYGPEFHSGQFIYFQF